MLVKVRVLQAASPPPPGKLDFYIEGCDFRHPSYLVD